MTGEYTPRGTKENVASKYEDNILGQMIQSEIPQEKKDGSISYQTTTTDKGKNTEKQYYVTDPHGNVVQLTDESGAVIKTYEYDSFGNEVKPDGKDDNPFRYCGEYYDKETEEVYLRARYYQPEVGRFLTRDTYTGEDEETLSLHLYTFCENDGVNSVDTSGYYRIYKVGYYWYSSATGTFYSEQAHKDRLNKMPSKKFKKKYGKQIKKIANKYKIDVNYLGAVALTESSGSGFHNERCDKELSGDKAKYVRHMKLITILSIIILFHLWAASR